LNSLYSKLVEERSDVVVGELNFLAVDGRVPEMGSMLRCLWFLVSKTSKSIGDVFWHGKIDPSLCVVPDQGEAEVRGTGPVDGDDVFFAESGKEMFGVWLGKIFNSKIINGKSEGGSTSLVVPEAGSEGHG
jgi:hypothetical protein